MPDAARDAHVPSSGDGAPFAIGLGRSARVAFQGEGSAIGWDSPCMGTGKIEGISTAWQRRLTGDHRLAELTAHREGLAWSAG